MENLREEYSLELYLKAFEFLTIWAVVHPAQFAGLMDRLSDYIQRIKAQMEKDRRLELARMAAVALEKFCDSVVDEAVADAARDAFAKYGSRDDARYTLLIPENLTDALRPVGGDAQTKFVKNVVTRIDEDPEYKYLKGRATQIRKAQEILEAATEQKNERQREEDLNRADRDRLKAMAAEEYRFFHPELLLKFRDDPKRVEMFFLALTKKNNKGPEE